MSNYNVIEGARLQIKAWTRGVQLEDAARQQLINLAGMPFIHKHVAAMPDVHLACISLATLTKPAECANGCPPLQVCDHCQGTGGKDKPADAGVTDATKAKKIYAHWTDNQGIHSNRFPAWHELTKSSRDEWLLKALAARHARQGDVVACPYCDNTGDVHSPDGEWRGECKECKTDAEVVSDDKP